MVKYFETNRKIEIGDRVGWYLLPNAKGVIIQLNSYKFTVQWDDMEHAMMYPSNMIVKLTYLEEN